MCQLEAPTALRERLLFARCRPLPPIICKRGMIVSCSTVCCKQAKRQAECAKWENNTRTHTHAHKSSINVCFLVWQHGELLHECTPHR